MTLAVPITVSGAKGDLAEWIRKVATALNPLIGGDADEGDNLEALSALDDTAGLLEQTGHAAFTKRALGVGASTSVLTLADGDARYLQPGDPVAFELILANFTVATLPAPGSAGIMVFVTDETGGPVPAWDDGTNWRRVSDGAIVS